MKTTILQLDLHDDVVSACDKMAWGKGERILLVWPLRGRILTRRLDLVLLKRRSAEMGAQLALLTHDGEIRAHARQLGIPVFRSLKKAQSVHWRVSRFFQRAYQPSLYSKPAPKSGVKGDAAPPELAAPPRHPLPPRPERPAGWPKKPASRVAVFLLGIMAILSMAAVLVPSARLDLSPQVETQELRLAIYADPEQEQVNLSGVVPARLVSVIVEGRDSEKSSGSMILPQEAAVGLARFTNLTDQKVSIPAGTIVRTPGANGIRFATTESGEAPSGPGQVVSLKIRAVVPGKSGNLPAGLLRAIEGQLGTQLSVSNPQATLGGSERSVTAPSPADRLRLTERLMASLHSTALDNLQGELADGELLLPSSLSLSHTLGQEYSPQTIQPSDWLFLDARLEFSALIVDEQDLHALAESVLDANLPDDFQPARATLAIENEGIPEFNLIAANEDLPAWTLRATRQMEARLPASEAVALVQGRTPLDAAERLASGLPLAHAPDIRLFPAWWPRLPFVTFRIQVLQH